MTERGGVNGACASCRHRRRRCAADCPLAPYFPAEQPKLFVNVHRLFGVENVLKILEKLDEDEKPEAMKAIIFESHIRDRSPVHGCLGFTRDLEEKIRQTEEELKAVASLLLLYRSQQNPSQNLDLNLPMVSNHQQEEKEEDAHLPVKKRRRFAESLAKSAASSERN